MNEQTLELQIKSKAQEAKSNVESLVKSLVNVENVLTNIYLELGSIEKKSSVDKTVKQIDTLKSKTDKATTSVKNLNKALSLSGIYLGAKRLTNQLLGWMNEAIDQTEQKNLFNVVFDNIEKDGKTTFSNLGKEATKFQYKLNETFGTNKTETLYMQGIYQSMGETVGIPENYSAIMSETTTKLTYDLASLFNKSEKTTAEALRAGVYAGQTKPLRAYGIDVTQMSLQPILDSLGIDRQVKEMSQAEKEILRYLATLKQANIAMGDLANTIESPSNQMKVFRQQLVETKVAMSSLFIGTFANVLPYFNAFLMVVKEISNAIATMFGIELKDYNSGLASQENIYDDIEESANSASKAVKELKRQTLGFDEIHNINENTNNGSGTSISGGIDQRLLDAITGYDNGMDKVRMKANQIRDSIMDWLGFTKKIDPLTGKVSFKLKEGYTNLEKIFDLAKLIGITMLGWKISKTVTSFFKGLEKPSFSKNFKKTAGLTILFTSLIYNIDAVKKQLTDGPDLSSNIEGIISGTGLGVGTYLMTKNLKLSLIITAASLVWQSGVSIKKLWDDLMNSIDEYANNDGKTTFIEFWTSWWHGMQNVMMPSIGNFLNNIFISPFKKINSIIEENGGYWNNWKSGMKIIFESTKREAQTLIDKIRELLGLQKQTNVSSKGGEGSWGGGGGGNRANGGVYSNGSWKNIPQYANGGIPSHGTMFVAGEAGAEIVGHINGKTEVLNRSQIASAIYSAVVSAMSQFNGGGVAEIIVHADEGIIVETAINGINQKTRQNGVCPVNIPIY